MAKAKSGKPSGKPEAETVKPDEAVAVETKEVSEDQASDMSSEKAPEPETSASGQDTPSDAATDLTSGDEALDEATADDLSSSEVEDILADDGFPAKEEPAPKPAVVQEKVTERKGGFLPMALGGAVAAALGFGAAQFAGFGAGEPSAFEVEASATIEAQADAKKAIGIIDLNPIMTSVAGVEDALSEVTGSLSALETGIVGLDSRMTALEKAPVADAVGPEAIAAYEKFIEGAAGRPDLARQVAIVQRRVHQLRALHTR